MGIPSGYTSAQVVQAVPTGVGVLQVVTGTTSTQVSTSVASFVDTGLTATITPTSASNKILVVVTQNGGVKTAGNVDNGINIKLLRDATDIQTFGSNVGYTNSLLSLYTGTISTQFLDTPNTTSATTYKTQFANAVAAAAVRLQDSSIAASTIVLYEVTP